MDDIQIESKVKTYKLNFCDDLLSKRQEILESRKFRKAFFIVDQTVLEIYSDEIRQFVGNDALLVVSAEETNKEYMQIAEYMSQLMELGIQKNDLLITIGGGVLQDISGFIASILFRGVQWIFIPTTLLAQADSCIGSKTSINFKDAKNLVGTFYPPDVIYIDSQFCSSLSQTDLFSGIGEIIKFHLLSDQEGYGRLKSFLAADSFLEKQNLKSCIHSTLMVKKSYFEQDEFDTGVRNLLNYGHCFGHALESATNFAISHGQAVLVGMTIADIIAMNRGLLSESLFQEFMSLSSPYYPSYNLESVVIDDIIDYMKKDKKRVGKDLTVIMGSGVGEFQKATDVTIDEVKAAFVEFKKLHGKVDNVSLDKQVEVSAFHSEVDVPSILKIDGVMQSDFSQENEPHVTISELIASKDSSKSWCHRLVNTENNSATLISQLPGEGNRRHFHPNWNEWWYIIEGDWEWEIEGEVTKVSKGDFVFIEKNKLHKITAAGDKPAIRLAVSRGDVPHVYPRSELAKDAETQPKPV